MTDSNTGNQAQADMWTAAGPIWVELRDRFDDMADPHGRHAVDALAPAAGERVADVGCGAGSAVVELSQRVGPGGLVIGADISPTMIEGARDLATQRGCTNVDFVVADAMVEPIGRELDALFSRFGVMFFSDPAAAFDNLRRSLRPNGRMAFVCWKSAADNAWASVPIDAARRYVDIPFGPDPTAPGPFAFADVERVTGILSSAGFVGVEATGHDETIRVGDDHDDAVNFLLGLNPAVRALAESEPDRFSALRQEVLHATADWVSADGAVAPSATWVFTATNPG